MQVENILQSKGMTVLTVTTHAPISDAVHILNKHRIGAVVVLADNGTVAGILSERDIVRHLADDPARLLSRAVRETRGEIISYKGTPIIAYYSSTCGGHTADANESWPWRPPHSVSAMEA